MIDENEKLFECHLCFKQFKNIFSLSAHKSHCGKIRNKNKKIWNKGLTKETDKRVLKCSQTFKERVKLGIIIPYTRSKTKYTDESIKNASLRISNTVNEKIKMVPGIIHFQKDKYMNIKVANFMENGNLIMRCG